MEVGMSKREPLLGQCAGLHFGAGVIGRCEARAY